MIVDTYTEVFNAAAKILFFTNEVQKPAEMVKWRDGDLRQFLTIVEAQLKGQFGESKWLVSRKLTIADMVMVSLTFNILKNPSGLFTGLCKPMLLEFPNYGAYTKRL